MTAQELAALLHGRQYERTVATFFEVDCAKRDGLVIVYGASDDLMEFEGAIYDEVGAPGVIRVCGDGLLNPWPKDRGEEPMDEEDAQRYFRRKAAGFKEVEAVWCPEGMPNTSWLIKTDIPHATFDLIEDGDVFCRGIVFALADVAPAIAPSPKERLGDLLSKVNQLQAVRASEFDGEESDGTPKSWRDRPYVSLRELHVLLRRELPGESP